MNTKYIFPLTLILLDIGAGIVYGVQGDYKKTYLLVSGGRIKYHRYILKGR